MCGKTKLKNLHHDKQNCLNSTEAILNGRIFILQKLHSNHTEDINRFTKYVEIDSDRAFLCACTYVFIFRLCRLEGFQSCFKKNLILNLVKIKAKDAHSKLISAHLALSIRIRFRSFMSD